MQFLFAPVWGRMSDRIGRKPLLIASLAGDVVFYTLFGLAHDLPTLYGARILAGIFSSGTLSIAQAYAADITPPDQRAVGLGILGACFGVGFVFGPAIGGILGAFNLQLPLFFAAFLALVNLIYIARALPESLPKGVEHEISGPPASLLSRLALMAQATAGPVGFLYLLTFAVTFAFANLEGTFTTYLIQHFHYTQSKSAATQGGVFTYVGFLIVLVQGGAIRPLVKKYGEGPLVIAGVGLMAAGFLLFPLMPSLALLLIGPMLALSIGSGLNSPSLRALVSRKTAATAQGAALGLSASFDSLARAIGPSVGGWLYAHYGQATPYWAAGVIMALCFAAAAIRRGDLTAPQTAGASGEAAAPSH
jgi:multidrug resistance protein